MENGVPEDRIIFINLVRRISSDTSGHIQLNPKQISSPEGLKTFSGKFPRLKVITGWIDQGLNEKAYIIPGLGDFGERRYCE